MTNLERLRASRAAKDEAFARQQVAETSAKTPDPGARLAMAKAAVKMGNYDAAGIAVWQAYLDAGAPKS